MPIFPQYPQWGVAGVSLIVVGVDVICVGFVEVEVSLVVLGGQTIRHLTIGGLIVMGRTQSQQHIDETGTIVALELS